MRRLLVLPFLLGVALAVVADAHAQSLVINDCQGFTRAVKSTEPGQTQNVQVQVSQAGGAPAQGAQVNLVNSITGQVISGTVSNGVVAFEGLTAGTYALTTTEAGLTIGTVVIGPAVAGAALATGALVVAGSGVVAAGAGAVVAADSLTQNSDDPTPTPVAPTPKPTSVSTPRPTPTPCPQCDPDGEPEPIDDFFDGQPPPDNANLPVLSPFS